MILRVFCDGGSRGNPGPAAAAAVIMQKNQDKWDLLQQLTRFLGRATNNQAEYEAVQMALSWIAENLDLRKEDQLQVYLDSQLVCNQLKGLYKVKNSDLAEKLFRIKTLEKKIPTPVEYIYIRREKNKQADALVNQTLDLYKNNT